MTGKEVQDDKTDTLVPDQTTLVPGTFVKPNIAPAKLPGTRGVVRHKTVIRKFRITAWEAILSFLSLLCQGVCICERGFQE